MQTNPYTTGKIASDTRFVGRREIVRDIIASLETHQVILIDGQRRIGKSSILSRLQKEIKTVPNGFVPVVLDLEQHLGEPLEDLIKQLVLLIHDRCELKATPPHLRAYTADNFRSWLVDAIFEIQGSDQQNARPGCLLGLFRWFFRRRRSPASGRAGIVLLLDEFDDVDEDSPQENVSAFYDSLQTILKIGGVRMIAVLGRDPASLPGATSALFRPARFVHVGLMSYVEIRSLAQLSAEALDWPDDVVDEICRLTHGHPLLAQLFFSGVWNKKSPLFQPGSRLTVSLEDVEEIHKTSVAKEFGHIVEYGWKILSPEEQVIVRFLASEPVSVSHNQILERIEKVSNLAIFYQEPRPNLISVLNGLKDKDWLEDTEVNIGSAFVATGNRYYVKIPIFGEYIQSKYALEQLVQVLFDDQQRSNALYFQATHLADDNAAIKRLEQALQYDPDNRAAQADLVEKIQKVIRQCLDDHEYDLVLSYAERMAPYAPGPAQRFARRARANIQFQIDLQKFALSAQETGAAIVAWFGNMVLFSPILVVLLSLSRDLFVPHSGSFSPGDGNPFPFLLVFLLAGITAFFRTTNRLDKDAFGALLFAVNVVGLLFVLLAENLFYGGQLVIAVFIMAGVLLSAAPVSDPSFTTTAIICIDLALLFIGYLGTWDLNLAKVLATWLSSWKR